MLHNTINLEPLPVFIRGEYINADNNPELIPARLATIKSIPGESFRVEVFCYEFGALYDKLPIEALLWKPLEGEALPTTALQLWNCFDDQIFLIKKSVVSSCAAIAYLKNGIKMRGTYLWTIDSIADNECYGYTDDPEHHKSFNWIALENGQFALVPNNRVQILDSAATPINPPIPKFKVACKRYNCELDGAVSDQSWFYKFVSEEGNDYT
jgi:hypothetical protein